jgi:hypothetical protein
MLYLVAQTPHTPNCSLVTAFETGSTEFIADTLTITIDLITVKEIPTKRKRTIVVKSNVKDARRMAFICNGRVSLGNLARPCNRCRTPSMRSVTNHWNKRDREVTVVLYIAACEI